MDYLCNLLMRAAYGGLACLGCLIYCSTISDSCWTCFLREIPLLQVGGMKSLAPYAISTWVHVLHVSSLLLGIAAVINGH